MSKRKTHEEFVNEIGIKHPNIKIIGTYNTSKDRILCECKIDGYRWSPTAGSLCYGFGCPKCSGNAKITHEEFKNELFKKNQNIELLGTYVNSYTKILCKCKLDGYEWYAKPSNLLHLNRGCPECAKIKISNALKLSNDEFLIKLEEFNDENGTFWTSEEEYKGFHNPIKFKCSKDGFEIVARPSNLFNGCYKCHNCYKESKIRELNDYISEHELPIEIIGDYIDSSTNIKCKCTICGNEYYSTPNRIIQTNSICRKCAYIEMGINKRLPIEEFLHRLEVINPNVEYIDGYINMSKNVNVKCKKCGYKWSTRASSLIGKVSGCPNCNCSKGENKIRDILDYYNIEYISQKTFDGLVGIGNLKLRYDFYLPNYNVLIEYQGIQHEKPIDFSGRGKEYAIDCFEKQIFHDKTKKDYALKNNIKLFEIWYYDFDKIDELLKKELDLSA